MALQINTELNTRDGGTVATGAYVRLEVNFPAHGGEYNVTLNIWRNKAAYDEGKQQVRGIADFQGHYVKAFQSPDDYNTLSPAVVHNTIKNEIELVIGVGTVVVVD